MRQSREEVGVKKILSSAEDAMPVTLDTKIPLTNALLSKIGGDVTVVMKSGREVLIPLTPGVERCVRITKVLSTGNPPNDILALYW